MKRIQRVRGLLTAQGLDALFVSGAENRRYMSGFTGSAGILIITSAQALLATDFRYYEQVKTQAPDFELVEVVGPMAKALAAESQRLGLRRIGFESQNLTVETYQQWQAEMPEVDWAPTKGLVESLRMVKDEAEIGLIEDAVHIADAAMMHIMEWMRPGVTEREVSWELEVHMRTHGAEKLSFTTIIGSGPNGAMSHAVTSERPIAEGDPVVIDMGAMVQGYCSDLTRSFCLGRASEEYLAIWNTVLQAQQAAERAIRPGLSGVEADATARRIIYGAGYEGKFGHGLGHGVGLAIHEDPRAGMISEDTLAVNHILTVEPGIYLPGVCGVRIEDMVVVAEDGCRVLTQCPKVPVIAGR
jgi:Xaa-Pro aminopeptidase